jgi:peptidoglycan/xylan/chitin deacetylase (PgdA/CDA1 family)
MSWDDRLARVVGGISGTRGAILCLHGLHRDGEPGDSPMHLSLTQLDATLEIAGHFAELVPLADLVERHLEGRSTARMLALTADDAYASWLDAEPLLRRRQAPITMFAVASALASGSSFWWDRLDHVVVRVSEGRWRTFEDECGLPNAFRIGHAANSDRTRALRQWILADHAGRWPQQLENPLQRLEQETNSRTGQRPMREDELAGFVSRTSAGIGVHTRSHAALPFLADQEVIAEIQQGHAALRDRFSNTRPYLAIPFGLFTRPTLELARRAGMTAMLTLTGSPLEAGTASPDTIPRLCMVREQGPGKTTLKASRLGSWLNRIRNPESEFPVLPSATS